MKLPQNILDACGTIRDRGDAITLVLNVLEDERARCERIINAARCGEIDSDLRCIKSRIMSGSAYPEETP